MSDSNEHISKEKTNTKTSLAEDINSKSEKYRMDSLNEFEKKADEFSQKAKKDLVIKKPEEEKNSEDKQISQNQYIINRQQMFKEAEAQKFENLKRKQKFYDDLLNNIIDNWNNNQENFNDLTQYQIERLNQIREEAQLRSEKYSELSTMNSNINSKPTNIISNTNEI